MAISNPKSLSEAGVLIAGGTSGVGLASAVKFALAGVPRIVLLARDRQRGEAAIAELRLQAPAVQAVFVSADANDYSALQTACAEARTHLGTVDILVNSTSSIYTPELLHNTPIEDIQDILNKQVLPPMYLCRIVLPWMREQQGGSIINMSSDAAKFATPGETVLGGAMAAIVMFSRTLAMEAKRDGIRVNVLTPSLIAGTPTALHVTKLGFGKKLFEKAAAQAHLGVAEPEDVAELIVFLGSPASARLTGQAISVNGGISAG
jgi:NAD(P)-dependent dehydrogenase (short-subunit alcohol dehydrogenase family)